MRPPRFPRSLLLALVRAFVLGLVITSSPALAATLDYNVTFSSPLHTVGQPPTVGAGPAPRATVSAIPFGTPQVVASQGALTTQPLRFSSADNQGDQIQVNLNDLAAHPAYDIQAQVLITSMAPSGTFSFVFDTPTTRNLSFNASGQITMVVPPAPLQVIGTYTVGQVMNLEVNIDLTGNHWDILIDGAAIHSGGFGGATQLNAVRIGTNVTANPPAVVTAIDNLVITNGAITVAGACNRLEFEDRPLGGMPPPPVVFRTEGVLMDIAILQCPGQVGFGINTAVIAEGRACGSGRELDLSQMAADIDFEGTVTDVTVPFRHHSGLFTRVLLMINEDCRTADDFTFFDGLTIGGVLVHAEYFGTVAQSCGMLTLEGSVNRMRVGGTSEFYLDNVSYCRRCPAPLAAGFDNLALGAVFPVNAGFASGNASFLVSGFFPPGATCANPVTNGVAVVGNQGLACGTNRELELSAVNVKTAFNPAIDRMVLDYGEYGGNVNLTINEVC
ncbi:MAG TPA: hypothetical protein VNM87_03470, partial [Candidatus Udaeobacter sp.]|nr:hypothetical protein [Candidatus Udaeobacter sp.]